MSLAVGCPQCAAPVTESAQGWICATHAAIEPMWRTTAPTYDDFAEHLLRAETMPTYLPWPLSPGWSVTDFAGIGAAPQRPRATMTCASGLSELDGPVDVAVIAEEPGTGFGARVAGLVARDPGAEIGGGAPAVRVRIGRQVVPLWPVSTSSEDAEWDRSVVAGEAEGRWLWLVLRPASAILLLQADWILRDASQVGPALVELPFGGPAPSW